MTDVAMNPAPMHHDDDDDMADLFSFGTGDHGSGALDLDLALKDHGAKEVSRTRKDSNGSHDSFLDMLDAETTGLSILDGIGGKGVGVEHDKETEDILKWLDRDDAREVDGNTEEIVFAGGAENDQNESTPNPAEEETQSHKPTVVAMLPPTFETLEEALKSKKSTKEQIRSLAGKRQSEDKAVLSNTDLRPELYCRMICGKSLTDTASSSLADSFEQWRYHRRQQQSSVTKKDDDAEVVWIRRQAKVLALNVAEATGRGAEDCEVDLTDLLLYHYQNNNSTKATQQSSETTEHNGIPKVVDVENRDLFVPAVAAAILSSNVPVTAASVLLAQMIPNYMPLLALLPSERWQAALTLHAEFYLLACYHIPLLVFHLDRYLPGWQWPQVKALLHEDTDDKENDSSVKIGRNLTKQGQVPPSWLMCHLAGECSVSEKNALILDAKTILTLWDGILTSTNNNTTRFFLALAVLEEAAEKLILLTGEELTNAIQEVWKLPETYFPKDLNWRESEWWKRAQSLQKQTPNSVMQRLQKSEDVAVQEALKERHLKAEAEVQARLEAEATAHKQAQELAAKQARERLSRARLVAFYRKHSPDKESNIDKIMETYAGRLEVLDAKLRYKYGEGFNPALDPEKPKPEQPKLGPNKFLATMNQSLSAVGRRKVATSEDASTEDFVVPKAKDQVSVTVTPDEVLPIVCWSKEASAARGVKKVRSAAEIRKDNLKFYLVDSRSEEAASEQGRFPTALDLGPEVMMDPERIRQNEERFESLRGACHIVVMGEGFSSLPKLYNQRITPKLEAMMKEDESRTNLCALFFVKKGFPFVSVLDGGFAAAHSWLVREGPRNNLSPASVLVDYDAERHLFGQLETLHNSSATEKAQRRMQRLLEASLVTMTKQASHFDKSGSNDNLEDTTNAGAMQGLRISMFATGKNKSSMDLGKGEEDTEESKKSSFMIPFTMLGKKEEEDRRDNATNPPSSASSSHSKTPSETFTSGPSIRPDQQVNNALKGFGAAFNNTMKSASVMAGTTARGFSTNKDNNDKSSTPAMPNMLKRNPFARFGNLDGNKKPSQEGTSVPGFGSFNQFRRSTISRMNRTTAGNNADEEAISFGSGADVKKV